MTEPIDPFLRHRSVGSRKGDLGRVFGVTRETWALSDDPKITPPRLEVLASRRTAAEAADFAREAAMACRRHGFHKPSGAWWGVDEVLFHRFIIRARQRPGRVALLVAAGLASLAAVGLAQRRSGRPSSRKTAR